MSQKRILLTQAEQATIRKVQADATAHLADLDRGDKCGIDCGPLREGTQELLTIANNLMQHFGTHRE